MLKVRRSGRRVTIEAAVMPRPGSMMVQIMVSVLESGGVLVGGDHEGRGVVEDVSSGLTEDVVGVGELDEVFDAD